MNVGTAVFRAVADFNSVISQSDKASSALDKMDSTASKTGGGLSSFFSGVVKYASIAASAVGAIFTGATLKAGYDRMTVLQDSTKALAVTLGSATDAASLMGEILKVVTGTPFSLSAFAQAGQQLVGFGVDAKKVPTYLTAIGEAAAQMGAKAPQYAEQLSTAFGRIASGGRVTQDEINMMSEVGVNALAILANHFGVTTDVMRKMVAKGTVPAQEGMDALANGILNGSTGVAGATVALKGTMASLNQTVSGTAANLKTGFARFGASILTPFSDTLIKGFTGATLALDTAGKKIGTILVGVVASPGFAKFQSFLVDLPNLVTRGFGTIDSTVGKVQSLWATFAASGVARDTVSTLSTVFSRLAAAAVQVAPSVKEIIVSLSQASAAVGISTWQILLSVLDLTSQLLVGVLVPALTSLAGFMREHQSLVTGVVGAYTIWKVAMLGMKAGQAVFAALKAVQLGYAAATYGAAGATYAQTAASKIGLVTGRAVAVATKAWAAAQWLLNAAMSANPIALIIIGIAALVAGFVWLWNNVAGFRDFWIGAWNWIKSAASAVWDWVVQNWPLLLTILTGPIGLAVAMIIQHWDTVKAAFSAVWEWIQSVWGGFSSWFGSMWDAVVGFFQRAWAVVMTILSYQPLVLIVRNWGGIVAWFAGLWANITSGVSSGFNAVLSFFTGLPGRMLSALGNLGSMLYNSGRSIIQGLIDGVTSMIRAVTGAVSSVLSKIRNLFPFSPAKEGPFSGRGWTLYSGRSIMSALATGVGDNAGMLKDAVGNALDGASMALNVNGSIKSGLGAAPSNVVSAIMPSAKQSTNAGSKAPMIGSLTVVNPVPERASDSVATVVRRKGYGGSGRAQ